MLIWSVPYPVCLPRRWKWEEINIGLSHHLVAHRIEVQRLSEDFDYSPALCQTRFKLFITAIVFSFLFLSSSPCCLCCCHSVWRFVTHQVRPVLQSLPINPPTTPLCWSPFRSSHTFKQTLFYRVFFHTFFPFSKSKLKPQMGYLDHL